MGQQYKNVQERLKAQQAAAEAKARGEVIEEEDDEIHPLTKMFMQGNFKGSYDESAVETGNFEGWNLNDFR